MPRKNMYKNSAIGRVDWTEQNEKDLKAQIRGEINDDKELMTTYFGLEERERKEYVVNYEVNSFNQYIPYITKNEIRNDGKIERTMIQVGRALSPQEYDILMGEKYEQEQMDKEAPTIDKSVADILNLIKYNKELETGSEEAPKKETPNIQDNPNSTQQRNSNRRVQIGEDLPTHLL